MTEKLCWESFKAESATLAAKIKALAKEGNVRRVVVEHDGRTVAEFPLTAGVIGLVAAPVVAAVGALVALLEDCTIRVARAGSPESETQPSAKTGTAAAVDAEC